MDTAAVAYELHKNWNCDAQGWTEICTKVFPQYLLLIESHAKAQDIANTGEVLDSQLR